MMSPHAEDFSQGMLDNGSILACSSVKLLDKEVQYPVKAGDKVPVQIRPGLYAMSMVVMVLCSMHIQQRA